jgi:hypothetical protein
MSSFNYKIYKDKKLIIESFTGDIDFDFFKESMLKDFKDPEYVNMKFGVCDLRKANLTLTNSQIKESFDFALQHDKNKAIRWATITKGPNETAMAMIYELQAEKHYGYKIFSTLEGASNYLGIRITEENLKF